MAQVVGFLAQAYNQANCLNLLLFRILPIFLKRNASNSALLSTAISPFYLLSALSQERSFYNQILDKRSLSAQPPFFCFLLLIQTCSTFFIPCSASSPRLYCSFFLNRIALEEF